MEKRVAKLLQRFSQVEEQLGQPDVFDDQKRYKELTQEHSYLSALKDAWEDRARATQELADSRELLKSEQDPEFTEVLREEIEKLEGSLVTINQKIETLLVPPDPNDSKNTILELRAGTGGDEAALFVGDCVRMYKRYADTRNWKIEELGATPSEAGGYKEYVMVMSGTDVHRMLQYEGGTHRVQRVPETETQGRVHTSAMTLAVMPEPEKGEFTELDEKDLEIDTYRASGAGGQHVNTTDSAVRITHKPTGLVSTCQDERSQHKNKDQAMRLLTAKIADAERQRLAKERADARAVQVGSGDRSDKIRTYNFPQNRITDHRINLTKYNLDQVMEGALDDVIQPLIAHFHQLKMSGDSG